MCGIWEPIAIIFLIGLIKKLISKIRKKKQKENK